MGPVQDCENQEPSLKQALAAALLIKRRCGAAVKEAEGRCASLQREVEQLRAEAAAPQLPQPPQPPLLQVAVPAPAAAEAAAAAALASPAEVQQQLESVAVWHQGAAALPPELRSTLAQVQRYLLLAELQRPSTSLPAAGVLRRTPVRACLELAADVLHTQAAAAAAAPPLQPPTQVLTVAHGQLLAAACACLVHLCDRPGQAAVDADYAALQQFGFLVLQLVAQPPAGAAQHALAPTPDSLPSASGPAVAPGTQPDAGGGAIELQQPTSGVAHTVLALLRRSATAGMCLLSCAAPAARDCLAELAALVTGEPPLAPLPGSTCTGSSAAAACLSQGLAAAAAEEARLLHAFGQLSQQLSAGLRLLPQWIRAVSIDGDAFMQDVAAAILAARDASQLISVTHPAAARQAQRTAAQLMTALQQISAEAPAE